MGRTVRGGGPIEIRQSAQSAEDGGAGRECIERETYTPRPEDCVARAIMETARDESFKTIVVGRSLLPWCRDVWRHPVGDELPHKAGRHGVTIRVVQ